jgi:hypothetical protein
MQPGHPLHPEYQPSVKKIGKWNPETAKPKRGLASKLQYKPHAVSSREESSLGHHIPPSIEEVGTDQIEMKPAEK